MSEIRFVSTLLRIRDVSIRTRGSVSDRHGSGSYSILQCLIGCLLLTVGTFASVLTIKMSQTVKIIGFLKFVCLFLEVSGTIQITTDPDPGGAKTYGSGSGTLAF